MMPTKNAMENSVYISTDKTKLDLDLIHNFLSRESYWAKGRSIEVVKKSIEKSLCFGVFLGDAQIGFARVVSDYAVFAWILDVFILWQVSMEGMLRSIFRVDRGGRKLNIEC